MKRRTVRIVILAAGAIALALPSYSQGPAPVGKPSVWGGKVPTSIESFYDQVLDRLGGAGASADKIPQALARDWQTRPNPLNSEKGDGPGAEGVKAILTRCARPFERPVHRDHSSPAAGMLECP